MLIIIADQAQWRSRARRPRAATLLLLVALSTELDRVRWGEGSGNVLGPTADLTYIGLGKSSLDGLVRSLAARQRRRLEGDQFLDRGFFYRSDPFNFAKIGVPAIYLDSGTEILGKPRDWGKQQVEDYEQNRYHQPSDELEPNWNYDGMIQDAQLGFYAGLAIANGPQLPAWNPGDEFEAARKRALGEVGPVGFVLRARPETLIWDEP